MASAYVNGIRLFYQVSGDGDPPLVLVHGSWVSQDHWALVTPLLARSFRVVTYDRRGHSRSERPPGQGSVHQDVADLAGLIEDLDLGQVWVAGNSFGGSIALRLAAERPDLLGGVVAHEPPLFALLAGDPELAPVLDQVAARIGAVVQRIATGDHAGAAEQFVETVALGPGAWAQLPDQVRQTFITNAPTYADECRDPDQLTLDLDRLGSFGGPVLLTMGDHSPPTFAPVVATLAQALPHAQVVTLASAGHIPHVSHPDIYVQAVATYITSKQVIQAAG
ncbi:MAG TPA: alpha/beta hydrolase [Actinomycetes bacterium]|jgi:pimeloyl-ACP methyl ester carboxylesterase